MHVHVHRPLIFAGLGSSATVAAEIRGDVADKSNLSGRGANLMEESQLFLLPYHNFVIVEYVPVWGRGGVHLVVIFSSSLRNSPSSPLFILGCYFSRRPSLNSGFYYCEASSHFLIRLSRVLCTFLSYPIVVTKCCLRPLWRRGGDYLHTTHHRPKALPPATLSHTHGAHSTLYHTSLT